MPLQSQLFVSSARLQEAARNAPPLRFGERGEAISRLQLALLAAGQELPISTTKMSAHPDGIFGQETARAVRGFQKSSGLGVDGVPGQNTLARLDQVMLHHPVSDTPTCGNASRAAPPRFAEIRKALQTAGPEEIAHLGNGGNSSAPGKSHVRTARASGGRPPGAQLAAFGGGGSTTAFAPAAVVTGAPSIFTFLKHLRPLSASQVKHAKSVFGNSLVHEFAFLCDLKPPNAAGVTVSISVPNSVLIALGISASLLSLSGKPTICVLFVGTFSPSNALLIHELTHVWQSQHHPDPTAYESNSLLSQGVAEAVSAVKGVKASAYACKRGKPFGEYCAEQIADQVECGVASVVKIVKSASPLSVVSDNVQSLSVPRYAISGGSGIVRCSGGTTVTF